MAEGLSPIDDKDQNFVAPDSKQYPTKKPGGLKRRLAAAGLALGAFLGPKGGDVKANESYKTPVRPDSSISERGGNGGIDQAGTNQSTETDLFAGFMSSTEADPGKFNSEIQFQEGLPQFFQEAINRIDLNKTVIVVFTGETPQTLSLSDGFSEKSGKAETIMTNPKIQEYLQLLPKERKNRRAEFQQYIDTVVKQLNGADQDAIVKLLAAYGCNRFIMVAKDGSAIDHVNGFSRSKGAKPGEVILKQIQLNPEDSLTKLPAPNKILAGTTLEKSFLDMIPTDGKANFLCFDYMTGEGTEWEKAAAQSLRMTSGLPDSIIAHVIDPAHPERQQDFQSVL